MLRLRGAFLPKTGGSGERSQKAFEMVHKMHKNVKDMQYHFLNGVAPKSVSCYDCSKKETDTIRR